MKQLFFIKIVLALSIGVCVFAPLSRAEKGTPLCKVFNIEQGEGYKIYIRDSHIRTVGYDPDKKENSSIKKAVSWLNSVTFGKLTFGGATENQWLLNMRLQELRQQGICHGVYMESAKEGKTQPSAEFLQYDEPKTQRSRKGMPVAPRMVDLRDKNGFLVGAMSEFLPSRQVFITNRHVLAGLSYEELGNSLGRSGIKLEEMSCYRFFKNQQVFNRDISLMTELDAVVLVPKKSEAIQFMPVPEELPLGCGKIGAPEVMPLRMYIHDPIQIGKPLIGDEYYTHQFGWVGDQETVSESTGTIAMQSFSQDKLYLPPSDFMTQNNPTTLRGSGSVVYTRHEEEPWKVGGILECKVPGEKTKSGIDKAAAVAVLPFADIVSAIAFKTDCASPEILELRPADKDCVPINGRGGGGE